MQDIAHFVQMAQTLCYDLARAEKAKDGKKKKKTLNLLSTGLRQMAYMNVAMLVVTDAAVLLISINLLKQVQWFDKFCRKP